MCEFPVFFEKNSFVEAVMDAVSRLEMSCRRKADKLLLDDTGLILLLRYLTLNLPFRIPVHHEIEKAAFMGLDGLRDYFQTHKLRVMDMEVIPVAFSRMEAGSHGAVALEIDAEDDILIQGGTLRAYLERQFPETIRCQPLKTFYVALGSMLVNRAGDRIHIAALTAKIKALNKYCQHTKTCASCRVDRELECDCGLSKLLKEE